MLGKVIRTRTDTEIIQGAIVGPISQQPVKIEGLEVRRTYNLHEDGVSHTTTKRPVGTSRWTRTSTSEIPLPKPLMEMLGVV